MNTRFPSKLPLLHADAVVPQIIAARFHSFARRLHCESRARKVIDGGLSGKLMVTGSSTVAPLVSEIAKRFEQLHPDVRVDVQTGGSGKGIADARIGVADIGMASRALKDEESDLVAHKIAADGVGLIVHQVKRQSRRLTPEASDRDLF